MDNIKDFATTLVATAPSPATSGTSLVVTTGQGTRLPAAPFYATAHPDGQLPTLDNAELIYVSNITTDTLTFTRANGDTTAQSIDIGWRISNVITKSTFDQYITELSEDTTPQLGGDLDLNSSDITGTGNINITGTLDVTGNSALSTFTSDRGVITNTSTVAHLSGSGNDCTFHMGDPDTSFRASYSFERNLPSGDTNSAVFNVQNSNSGDDQPALRVFNESTGNGLLIDQNGNGFGLQIDTEATNQTGAYIIATASNSGGSMLLRSGDSSNQVQLTRGDNSGTATNWFYRNRASSLTNAPLVLVEQDEATDDQVALQVQQDGTGNGLFIDQNGNGIALDIDNDGTSYAIAGDSGAASRQFWLGNQGTNTGIGTHDYQFVGNHGDGTDIVIVSSRSTTHTGYALDIQQLSTSSGKGARITNDGTGNGLLIDQNGNGVGMQIDNDGGNVGLYITQDAYGATNARGIDLRINGDLAGASNTAGMLIYSNTAHTANNFFFDVTSDNASSIARIARFRQDAAATNVTIDQNGDGVALEIDSEASSSVALSVNGLTSANLASFIQESGATGRVALFQQSDTSSTADVVEFNQQGDGQVLDVNKNATGSGNAVDIRNEGTGIGLLVDQNGAGTALNIDTATSSNAIDVTWRGDSTNSTYGFEMATSGASAFTGDGAVLRLNAGNASDTGRALLVTHSGTSLSGKMVDFIKYGTGAGTAVGITNDGTGIGLFVDQNGAGDALKIDQSANATHINFTGDPSNSSSADGDLWFDGTNLKMNIGGTVYNIDVTAA